VKKLVIENCPRINKLNVRSNLLTDLEFLKSLPHLEELELEDGIKLSNESLRELLDLQEKNDNLEKKYNNLKNFLKEV